MERKINLKIKSYKVPIRRVDKEIEEEQIPLTEDMVTAEEEVELESILKLTELAQKVGQYNQRQIKYAEEDTSIDYVVKKIIVK